MVAPAGGQVHKGIYIRGIAEEMNGYMYGETENGGTHTIYVSPVPFDEHWYLRLKIDLTLNGRHYAFDRQVNAAERKNLRPLLLYALE